MCATRVACKECSAATRAAGFCWGCRGLGYVLWVPESKWCQCAKGTVGLHYYHGEGEGTEAACVTERHWHCWKCGQLDMLASSERVEKGTAPD